MGILRVTQPFAVDQNGFHRVLRPGDLLDEHDPIITKGRRQFFEPVEAQVAREDARVEAASAAPGEKRTRSRAAKKAAPAKKPAAKPADKQA